MSIQRKKNTFILPSRFHQRINSVRNKAAYLLQNILQISHFSQINEERSSKISENDWVTPHVRAGWVGGRIFNGKWWMIKLGRMHRSRRTRKGFIFTSLFSLLNYRITKCLLLNHAILLMYRLSHACMVVEVEECD